MRTALTLRGDKTGEKRNGWSPKIPRKITRIRCRFFDFQNFPVAFQNFLFLHQNTLFAVSSILHEAILLFRLFFHRGITSISSGASALTILPFAPSETSPFSQS